MSHLVDTTEMYLKAIFELEEEGISPLRARLVERLEQSKPTVSETVGRLERDGLLGIDGSRVIALTPKGREQALTVMRKHRLAERLLLDVLGMPWADVHEEACRWEHVMSDAVEERLESLLENTDSDPYGNPIPALGGNKDTKLATEGLVSIKAWVESGKPKKAVLYRIAETLQTSPDLLRAFCAAGLTPGAPLEIIAEGGAVVVDAGKGAFELNEWQQAHLFVK